MWSFRRDRVLVALCGCFLASLFVLFTILQPKRLSTVSFAMPELESQLKFQLTESMKRGGLTADMLRDQSMSTRSHKNSKGVHYTAISSTLAANSEFLFQCSTATKSKVHEIFDSYVSLKYSVFEVVVKSEQYPVTYNPTILSLPPTSHYPFLIVARVRGDGLQHRSVICEGKYYDASYRNAYGIDVLSRNIGCATHPRELIVPQTPAKECDGREILANAPGFHDPRIFWSMQGAPIMILNQQSRYGCFGLWLIDLRSVYPSLRYKVNRALLTEYFTVVELTRTEGRKNMEKNYILFYDSNTGESYVQYELGYNNRHFSRLIGNGLATANLTSPFELPCIAEDATWHQATNALKVVLCDYGECEPNTDNTVYIAFLHKKEGVPGTLKVLYKRYLAVWKTYAPFEMVAFSSKYIRFDNEDEWEQKFDIEGKFLYTVGISWESNQNRYEGYLNEKIIISLGVGDHGNAAVVLPVRDMLVCMIKCNR
ncbi:hypothetical protein V1511DRAFT_458428 [Dipodascopsis uninucleata]